MQLTVKWDCLNCHGKKTLQTPIMTILFCTITTAAQLRGCSNSNMKLSYCPKTLFITQPQTFNPLSNFRSVSVLLLPSQSCIPASTVEKDLICKIFSVMTKLLLKPFLDIVIGNLLLVFLLAQGGWTR